MIVRPGAAIFSILSEVIFGAATEPRDCEFWDRDAPSVIEVPVDFEEDLDSEVHEVLEEILELVGQEEDSEFGAVIVDAPEVRSSKENFEEDSEVRTILIEASEDETPEARTSQEESEVKEETEAKENSEADTSEENSEDIVPEVRSSQKNSEDQRSEVGNPETKDSQAETSEDDSEDDAPDAQESEVRLTEEDSEDRAPEIRRIQEDSEVEMIIVDAQEYNDHDSEDQSSSENSESPDLENQAPEVIKKDSEDDISSEDSEVQRQRSEDQDSGEDSEVQEIPNIPEVVHIKIHTSESPTLHPSPPMNLRISIPTDFNFHCDQQDSGLPEEDLDWLIPEVAATSTACSFIKSSQVLRCRKTWADSAKLSAVSAHFKEPVTLVTKKAKRRVRKMAAEVIHQNEPHCFSTSNLDRPFKLLVQKETFLIDADSMSRISPIFSVMCFGKDFEKMDLSREIVDEKSKDIDCFLRAVHDTSTINSTNFALVLRLSNKYQVDTIIEACQQFIMRQHLDVLKPDEILTMLIASYEHHCQKEVVQKLIRRLASEGNTVFTKLRISRFLPAQVYGSVISTSMNLSQVREHETMNGHVLKLERSKIRWRQSVCEECKAVSECANCEECKKSYCRTHVAVKKCSNDYGLKLLSDLKKKIVDFEWND